MTHHDKDLPLKPYRVLDLTQGGCLLCGKVLADLGADVIQIEDPRGNPTRNIGPFYKDTPHPEKSLFWFAYSVNRRGITLDIEKADGIEVFKQLVKTADFVVESFDPGYMSSLGLGYDDLSRINPRVIVTSITPYGQTGPKSHYRGSDLTGWACGGAMHTMGDSDRAPTWISFGPQASLHGGVEGAAAALIAHWDREATGEGQQVDVSIQQCTAWLLQAAIQIWEVNRVSYSRVGSLWMTGGGVGRRQVYQCKDGYVAFTVFGGGLVGLVASTRSLVNWMVEESMAPEWLRNYKWETDFDVAKVTQEEVLRVEEPFVEFFLTKTKAELWDRAWKQGIILAPASDAKDLYTDQQLADRGYWRKLDHPELGESLTYCGPFLQFSETPIAIRRRAPLIGEHNIEVYQGELGLSKERLILLKQAGVI